MSIRPVADSDLKIRGAPGHPDPDMGGEEGGLKKNFVRPFALSLV